MASTAEPVVRLENGDRILEGRRAVVVGIGSDLGASCAVRLARDGAHVLAVDPNENALSQVEAAARRAAGPIDVLCGPHGDQATIDRVVTWAGECWGSLDALVVTAAIFDWWAPWESASMTEWETVLRTDLLMPIFYARHLRSMLERSGSGSVVFYGSIDGTFGNPRVPAYSAARGGLQASVRILAHEMGGSGVRVNLVAGAGIRAAGPDAPEVHHTLADEEDLVRRTDLGRRANADEIADVVAFLVGPRSGYITGGTIPVDGGRMTVTAGTEIRRSP